MIEKGAPFPDERQIAEALAEELDEVVPRRDLWPLVQARLPRRQRKPQKRCQQHDKLD